MNKDTGGSAYPTKGPILSCDQEGMTLRDYFAAKALPFALSTQLKPIEPYNAMNAAKLAYSIADAMLKAREK